MIINVKVKPGGSAEKITPININSYEASVKARAEKGKANTALIKLLAGHFGISSSKIRIKRGITSHNKIIEIQE
ncbi:MAG: DUF167 domain-containing protein [archaeon]